MTKVLLFILFILSAGCNYNHIKGAERRGQNISEEKLIAPDFMTVQMTVLGPKCLNCHANSSGNKGDTNLENYKNVRTLLNKVEYRTLELKDMPPKDKLSERELQILRNWLDSGAPEHQVADGEKPDPDLEKGATNWDKVRVKIFEKKCSACHWAPASAGDAPPISGLDLSSIVEVRSKANLIFDRLIIKQNMPLAPYPALTPRERRVLLKWFDMGMPE